MYKATKSFIMNKENYEGIDIKKGEILSEDFASQEIIEELLDTGHIVEYDGSLGITENGTYDVKDYESADVNVTGSAILQNKQVTITENTTTTVQADNNYDGLGVVEVITNVSGGATPTKGFTIDEWDENGYATKITVYGMTTIPKYFFGTFNETYNNSINTSLKKIILPDNITSIGEFAFASAQLLELDKLPNSLTSIGKFAFNFCKKLKIKTIPDGVTSLPQNVFSYITDIKQISMNNIQTLYSDGSYTTVSPFNKCTGLKSVWIGNAITSSGLGRYAFNGCTSLAHIYINLPRATVEGFTNYQYAFMDNTSKVGIIVCNDDEGFITKEEFDAIDWSTQ